jgi:predicted Zn-dependent protease
MLSMSALGAQTIITPPNNKYTAAEDVQLGREAAAEVEKQLPILRDAPVTTYVEGIGRRLAGAIPADLRHTEFRMPLGSLHVPASRRVVNSIKISD